MKITREQIDGLKLIKRSPDCGDGWRNAAPAIGRYIAKIIPLNLVEWSDDRSQCRLTDRAEILVEYL